MDFGKLGETMPTIGGLRNRLIRTSDYQRNELPQEVIAFINETRELSSNVTTMRELEAALVKKYGSSGDKVFTKQGIRCANVFGFPNTAIPRRESDIIIEGGETDVQIIKNEGNNIGDPLGWMSLNPAPTEKYGILGKVPATRPMADEFDSELYNQVMDAEIELNEKGVAIEIDENGEIAIMPITAIITENKIVIDKILSKYPNIPNLIGTAKYQGINS